MAYHFGHCNTCELSSNGWPHHFGNISEVQAHSFDMIVPVGCCCGSVIVNSYVSISRRLFVAKLRASQSNRWCAVESSVEIFSQRAIWGGWGGLIAI